MKKNLKYFISTVAMACSMALTSLAGQWVEYGGKWFYMTDDGNFAKNTWLWLDENHDTNAELYHFDASGIMSHSTSVTFADGQETLVVNLNGSGAATDYTHTYSFGGIYGKPTTRHSSVKATSLPPVYSVYTNYDGSYFYTSDVDHYDFNDICHAWINSIDYNGDCYSSQVNLIVYHNGSDPGPFGNFECSVKTTAKFADDCRVKTNPNSSSTISIEDFVERGKYYNYMSVDSVDSDGYITSCTIFGVE